jgi:hypothetical protein
MSVVHPEQLHRRSGQPDRESRPSEPNTARLRAKRALGRRYVWKRWTWIISGMLLVAVGWIIFNFLVTLVTLD